MIKRIFLLVAFSAALPHAWASEAAFDDNFEDRTLHLDYILAGNDSLQSIYLESVGVADGWAGRRHNLEAPLLRGNGAVTMRDADSGQVIYANSFSTLFGEWIYTPEAATVSKAFEDTRLVPMPKCPVDITLQLFDNRGADIASLTHRLDPADILIRKLPFCSAPNKYVHYSGSPEQCIDIAVVAEGYTQAEEEKFFADAQRAADALFSHEPFAQMADRFNVIAVATLGQDSGPSVPHDGLWTDTPHGTHYDTFYSARYLTTQDIHNLYESIAGVPAEHVILLVNTPAYGGGGIFNQLTVATSDHPTFKQVLVHEFGHAYAGLADEYFYEGEEDQTYTPEVEPWEPNITSLVDFDSKWADMLPPGTPVPTPVPSDALGVYEGAGYRAHGLYRPVDLCRMRVNEVDYFCPVCTRAIIQITDWYTK